MSNVDVVKTFGDGARPVFQLGGIHLDGCAAHATRKVVVVRVVHAPPVERLAAVGHNDVDLVSIGEFLQLAVDGRESDLAAVAHNYFVQVLGADEALDSFQGVDDLTALGGISSR
jgi:hypothetical protein